MNKLLTFLEKAILYYTDFHKIMCFFKYSCASLIVEFVCEVPVNVFFFSFEGHCCPFYDEGLGRVIEDFSRSCPNCPVQYFSDDYQTGMLEFCFLKVIEYIFIF